MDLDDDDPDGCDGYGGSDGHGLDHDGHLHEEEHSRDGHDHGHGLDHKEEHDRSLPPGVGLVQAFYVAVET